MGADITVFPWTLLHRGQVPDAEMIFHSSTVFNSSGQVQSELFTEENTCMTSSEDNQVSIPPQRFGISLTDDRGCDSSQQLAFHSVDFYRFFCWKPAPVHMK